MASECAVLDDTTSPYNTKHVSDPSAKANVRTIATNSSCVVFDYVYETLSEAAERYGDEKLA